MTCGFTGAINDGMMSLGSVWVVTRSDMSEHYCANRLQSGNVLGRWVTVVR